MVRSSDSQSENTGSNPVGDTKIMLLSTSWSGRQTFNLKTWVRIPLRVPKIPIV